MSLSEIRGASTSPPMSATTTTVDHHGVSFHDVLSAINPLQYLPVVGTIYRAVTGDVIPEALRRAGSMVVSGIFGGPIGLIFNIASTIVEKVTGVDPEKIVGARFGAEPPVAPPAEMLTAAPAAPSAPAASTQLAFTTEQLAAYGVRSSASGDLKLGDLEGADVLNTVEMLQLGQAAAAYAANQAMPLTVTARG